MSLTRARVAFAATAFLASTGLAQRGKTPELKVAVPAPTNVTAVGSANGVQISWTAAAGAAQYVVLRAANAGTAPTPIGQAPANVFTYLDKGYTAAAVYQVAAVQAGGMQGVSASVAVAAFVVSGRAAGIAAGPAVIAGGKTAIVPTQTQTLVANSLPARITGISPTKGAAPGIQTTPMQSKITISGAGFSRKPEIAVKFTGASGRQDVVATIAAKTDVAVDVLIPRGAVTGRILVETGVGPDLFGALSPTDFIVPTPIEVTGFSPDSVNRGDRITIAGRYFNQWDKIDVKFNYQTLNNPASMFVPVVATNVTATSFDVIVPQAAITGNLLIGASAGGPLSELGSSYVSFLTKALVVRQPLVISGFAPTRVRRNTGPIAGVVFGPLESQTTITGIGFLKQPELAVYFTGPTGAQDQLGRIWNKRDPEVMMIVPAGARTGKIKIVVGTGAAAETQLTAATLTVLEPVEITGISPASALRGSNVTIQGKGFLNRDPLSVQFGNQSGTVVAKTDASITVTVPGSAGTGKVSVTAGLGMEFETVPSAMDFTPLPTPTSIESFAPAIGAVGSQVTLTGYSHNSPVVNFANGVRAGIVSTREGAMTPKGPLFNTTVTVPQGAVTGPITMLTAAGSVASATSFTIPTFRVALTDFMPAAGNIGTVITLQGTFDPTVANNVVTFTGLDASRVTAIPSTGSASSLTVLVPAGTKTSMLSVASVNGPASVPKYFYMPPSVTGFSVTGGPVGYDIDVLGDNFGPNSTVKFNGVPVTSILLTSLKLLRVTIPAGATTGLVTVQTPGGIATSSVPFTVR